MKYSKKICYTRSSLTATAGRSSLAAEIKRPSVAAVAVSGALALTSTAFAENNVWEGTASDQEYNNPANWSLGRVPVSPSAGSGGFDDAVVNMVTNYPILDTPMDAIPRDVRIGNGGLEGRLDLTAGVGSTGSGSWLIMGDTAGSNGILNLADTAATGGAKTGFGQGSGSFTVGGTHATDGNLLLGNAGGSGTVNVNTSGSLTVRNDIFVGTGAGSNSFLNIDNGMVTGGSGATANGANWAAIGRDGGTGTLNMSGGSLTNFGTFWVPRGADATGTVVLDGGTIAVLDGDPGTFTTEGFVVARDASSTGTVNLNGGTLITSVIDGGAGVDTVNFNGTVIQATQSRADFINELDTAAIGLGGLPIDTNGFNITVPQDLAGADGGDGGVTKNGAGRLTLTGELTYVGPNTVNAGTLGFVAGLDKPIADTTLADGSALAVQVLQTGDRVVAGNITFGTSGATSLDIDLAETFPPTVAPLSAGTLVLNGDVTINVAHGFPEVGTYTLVEYGSKTGTGSFVLGSLPVGVTAENPVDDGSAVTIEITDVAKPVWSGAISDVWDTTTENWVNFVTLDPMLYADGQAVLFDDDFLDVDGSPDVMLNSTVTPLSVTYDNEFIDYSLSGTGKISGSTGLTKNGPANLTINNTNDYTGVTELAGGATIVDTLTAGGVAGPLGAASGDPGNLLLAGGFLEYTGPATTFERAFTNTGTGGGIRHANDLTLSAAIQSDGGGFGKAGGGRMVINNPGPNDLGDAGVVNIQGGELVLEGGGTQVNNIQGELWVATAPDVPAHMTLNDTTLSVSSWIALSRGNGSTGLVSNFDVNNSTITSGNTSSGFAAGLADNDVTTNITLDNSTWTNNGNNFQAENAGSTSNITLINGSLWDNNGASDLSPAADTATNITISDTSTMDLSGGIVQTSIGANSETTIIVEGDAQLNVDRFLMSWADGAVTNVTVRDSGSINKAGGGWLSIGNGTDEGGGGVATMTIMDNGSLTATGSDFNIADIGTSQGTLDVQGSATVTIGSGLFVGKNSGTTGTLIQSGGTLDANGELWVGRDAGGTALVTVSGGVFNQNVAGSPFRVGQAGTGTLTVSGTGTVIANGTGIDVAAGAAGTGTVNLQTGGVLQAKQVVEPAGGGASSLVFDGGTLLATAGSADFVTVDTVLFNASGGIIDTNGSDVEINQALSGAGGLTKTGAGILTLGGSGNYAGTTTVGAGTLLMEQPVLADSSTVEVTSGAIINLAHGQQDTIAQLIINGTDVGFGTFDASDFPEIEGTGSLLVQEFVATPYDTWAVDNGLTPGVNDDPEFDADGDGIDNVLEYVLGGDPLVSDTGILPEIGVDETMVTLTFNRSDESETDTTQTFQWGTDLGTWVDVGIGATGSGPDANGVTVTVAENGADPDLITVTLPRSLEVDGSLFVRLMATAP